MKKAFVYNRVSTISQEDNTSLKEQEQKCVRYAKLYDFDIVEIFTEVWSGADTERPKYQEMVNRLDEVDTVMVFKLDRLHRSLMNLMIEKKQFDEMKVSIVSVIEQFDTSTAQGKLFFNMIGSFGEFEKDIINQRMVGGKIAKMKNKRRTGGQAPRGYVVDGLGELLVDDKQAQIVKKIFELRRDGLSLGRISSTLLNEINEKISRQSIAYIIKNKAYTGRMTNTVVQKLADGKVNKKESYEILIPKIISTQLYNRVNKM